jgi:hypothetical protein
VTETLPASVSYVHWMRSILQDIAGALS